MSTNDSRLRRTLRFLAKNATSTAIIFFLAVIAAALGDIAMELNALRTELADRSSDDSTMDNDVVPVADYQKRAATSQANSRPRHRAVPAWRDHRPSKG